MLSFICLVSITGHKVQLPYNDDIEQHVPDHFQVALHNSNISKSGTLSSFSRSHSMKRHALTELQRQLPPHSFVDRAGLAVKNVHTMFDYFHNTIDQDDKSARVVAGWVHKINDVIQGGVPPSSSAIYTAPEKVPIFVKTLFRSTCFQHEITHAIMRPGVKAKVFELLGMTVKYSARINSR